MLYAKFVCLMLPLFALQESEAKRIQKRGVMDNFGDGIKLAGQMFGINTAADVANLVAKAFSRAASKPQLDLMSIIQQGFQGQQQQQPPQTESVEDAQNWSADQQHLESAQESPPTQAQTERPMRNKQTPSTAAGSLPEFNPSQMLTNVLRMIGFDASKLGALAINALVMVAQAIGNTLLSATRRGGMLGGAATYDDSNDQKPRELRAGTPIDWFMQNPNKDMQRLLKEATDEKLADKVITMIEQAEMQRGEGGCLKLLMCKSSPFIWGMQKSLKRRFGVDTSEPIADDTDDDANQQRIFNPSIFFKHMPSIEEFRKHGEQCEAQFASFCSSSNNNKTATKTH